MLAIIAITMATMLTACSTKESGKPKIAVSIPPQKYFLERITGDNIEVVCMLPNGSDPETYEPSMQNLLDLNESLAYLMMGNLAFETALTSRIARNNSGIRLYDSSYGVEIMTFGQGEESETDPHVWCSVKNARIIAKNMFETVAKLDPGNAQRYRENYDRFAKELDSLDKTISEKLEPLKGKPFLAWHPSLGYFARDYGLRQISLESENKEPSARQIKIAIEEAARQKAEMFFIPMGMNPRQAEAVNQQTGLRIVIINVLNYDWEKEIKLIADEIAAK